MFDRKKHDRDTCTICIEVIEIGRFDQSDSLHGRLDHLHKHLRRIEQNQHQILAKETTMTVALDGVRAEIANLRAAEDAQTAAITALADRLTGNPTPEEVAAVATELRDIATSEGAKTDAINALDPGVPTGPIIDDGNPA